MIWVLFLLWLTTPAHAQAPVLPMLLQGGKVTPPVGCAQNFVFDWSVSTGCDAITAVLR